MIIVEQLGLAIIPLCFSISSGLISGIISGTWGSILNALELSITTAPRLTASGANTSLTLPPANNAMSISLKESGFASSTVYSSPQTINFLPADLADAKSLSEANEKFLSSNKRINS